MVLRRPGAFGPGAETDIEKRLPALLDFGQSFAERNDATGTRLETKRGQFPLQHDLAVDLKIPLAAQPFEADEIVLVLDLDASAFGGADGDRLLELFQLERRRMRLAIGPE
jgi:hypothetical protein